MCHVYCHLIVRAFPFPPLFPWSPLIFALLNSFQRKTNMGTAVHISGHLRKNSCSYQPFKSNLSVLPYHSTLFSCSHRSYTGQNQCWVYNNNNNWGAWVLREGISGWEGRSGWSYHGQWWGHRWQDGWSSHIGHRGPPGAPRSFSGRRPSLHPRPKKIQTHSSPAGNRPVAQ